MAESDLLTGVIAGMSPSVRFEPIGEEIECASDETVLDAAFRQGYNLVYGCREGQCSACKCFLLEGEVALKRYSNFALSDSEQSSGYSLMCRAMPEQDLVVELLHYDPDGYRLEHAISDGEAVVEAVQPLTHDITRLVLRAAGIHVHSRPVRRPARSRAIRRRAPSARSRWPTSPARI